MNRTAIFLTVALGLSGLTEIPSAAAQTSATVRRPTAQPSAPVNQRQALRPRPQRQAPARTQDQMRKVLFGAAGTTGGTASSQPPVGCPDGWKPRPPELNPALGPCIADTIAAQAPPESPSDHGSVGLFQQQTGGAGDDVLKYKDDDVPAGGPRPGTPMVVTLGDSAAPEPPVGCPEGFKPRPPELNPSLGPCVPATITSKQPTQPGGGHDTGPIQSKSPVKCLEGTKPRPPELNPALGPCMPATITSDMPTEPGGGHDTGPIQNAQGHRNRRPDLALIASFQLGNVAIPWGTSAVVPADQAAFKRGGLCGFRYKYVTRNQGPVGAIATAGRIMRDAQNGPVLAANGLPALAPGAVAASGGHLSLKPGTWMLYVHTDAPLLVAESDEANNLRRVRVTVKGRCD